MKYTVITISDKRINYLTRIEKVLNTPDFTFVPTRPVDGRIDAELHFGLSRHNNPEVKYHDATVGQIGRWITFLDHCKSLTEPLLVLEDDACISDDFATRFFEVFSDVPEDADFFSLFIPRNKPQDIYEDKQVGPLRIPGIKERYDIGSKNVVRTYQPYGGVAMVLFPSITNKIVDYVKNNGITHQFDDLLYNLSDAGELNGYTVVPDMLNLIWITGNEPSTVHQTGIYRG